MAFPQLLPLFGSERLLLPSGCNETILFGDSVTTFGNNAKFFFKVKHFESLGGQVAGNPPHIPNTENSSSVLKKTASAYPS